MEQIDTGIEMEVAKLPRKKLFRQRAHANPFSDHQLDYPLFPAQYDWSKHFPNISSQKVTFADIGCGYGGLLMALSPIYPNKLIIGMEIRVRVEEFVVEKIEVLRKKSKCTPLESGSYQNISVMRMNAMKYSPNFFQKGQLEKVFFLFPDPHFKKRKHKARIVTTTLLAEYAYILKLGGLIYAVTDVLDLFDWMIKHLDDHPLFERVLEAEYKSDPCVECVMIDTEEGKKVERNKGDKYFACYRRIEKNLENWRGFDSILQLSSELE